jgi:erythromycin esterase
MKIKISNIIFSLVFFPAVVFCQYQDAIKWIDKNAVIIKTVRAENGFNDLMPLKSIFKDTRIVALGEATHGTKEIFQMKHRMLEFLVKEMGFRYFAIEANLTEAYAVNEYVMYGKGDPQKALDGLYFWTWNTKEVMAMIQWMRAYNIGKADRDKVRFYGFDMQAQPVAMSEFYKYIQRVDSGYACQVNDIVGRIKGFGDNVPDNNAVKECSGEVEKIFTHIIENKENYISATSRREYEIGKHNLVVVSQYIAMMSETDTAIMCQIRDSSMCENVKWLMNLEGDSGKFVLWAHNGHIAKDYVDSDGLTMGYFLKKFYRDKYYALGFDFYQGSFQSMDNKGELVEFHYTLKQNSTGYIFSQSRNKIFFIDFASAEKNKDMNIILHDTIPSICIGALFSEENPEQFYIKRPLADIYDGIIFIRNTNRAESNYNFQKKETSDFGNLMSRTDAKPYIGKQFKFSAFVKVGARTTDGQGQLWCRIDKDDKSMGFFDNMSDRPIKSKEWQYFEITGTVDKDAAFLYFGCMFIGKGELFVDDISLLYLENGQWLPVAIPDPAFEKCVDNAKPEEWRIYDKNYKISVTGQTSHTGSKCLKFKR